MLSPRRIITRTAIHQAGLPIRSGLPLSHPDRRTAARAVSLLNRVEKSAAVLAGDLQDLLLDDRGLLHHGRCLLVSAAGEVLHLSDRVPVGSVRATGALVVGPDGIRHSGDPFLTLDLTHFIATRPRTAVLVRCDCVGAGDQAETGHAPHYLCPALEDCAPGAASSALWPSIIHRSCDYEADEYEDAQRGHEDEANEHHEDDDTK